MRKIEMVDLKSQYQRIKPAVDEAMMEVIQNTQFIKGPQVKAFEENSIKILECKP
jgi:UDP-2-acetamido-2-deoxy-ribo-hexuluronate aminotransferase